MKNLSSPKLNWAFFERSSPSDAVTQGNKAHPPARSPFMASQMLQLKSS